MYKFIILVSFWNGTLQQNNVHVLNSVPCSYVIFHMKILYRRCGIKFAVVIETLKKKKEKWGLFSCWIKEFSFLLKYRLSNKISFSCLHSHFAFIGTITAVHSDNWYACICLQHVCVHMCTPGCSTYMWILRWMQIILRGLNYLDEGKKTI